MARLNLEAVEERVKPLGGREAYDREFIFELLAAYGKPKSSITRLRTGSLNVAEPRSGDIAQKGVVHFRDLEAGASDPLGVLETLRLDPIVERFKPRFLIVTDYQELVALDTKTSENLIIPIAEIDQHFTFFLPWAGMEKAQYVSEAHADVKAAEKMGKLFDELLENNPAMLDDGQARHGLNVFFTRLLFCLFAEDTGIFAENQFTNALGSFTQIDGSDVHTFLRHLFEALDTANPADKPTRLADFPYVNGRLFSSDQTITVPTFTKTARIMLIEMGTLMWQEINPDIFGSMFQAIVNPGKRSDLGQHYTSVPNILKTIEPLFLNELRDEFDKHYNNVKKLEQLLDRIADIRIFDPACGSGNFLVIAYKELRRLEHAILDRLADLDTTHQRLFTQSRIDIEHFYGIEIDDFAAEVAILSLWIAKHQMNREFQEKFGVEIPLIPLKETGHIHTGNAARMDWINVCPNNTQTEIYVISNPPFITYREQSTKQKEDFTIASYSRIKSKKLDYVSVWLIKGTDYIRNSKAALAFISTNSITQGEQVAPLFPVILQNDLEIGFAHSSFTWNNSAKKSAGVSVVVIGIRNKSRKNKIIYKNGVQHEVKNINAYLIDAKDIYVSDRDFPLSPQMPVMQKGSQPTDNGQLLLTPDEAYSLKTKYPKIKSLIKPYIGAKDYINGKERFCLWVDEDSFSMANDIPELRIRFEAVRSYRLRSTKPQTRKKALKPYKFDEIRYKKTESLIIPSTTTYNRTYIPIGYLGPDSVTSNSSFTIYDPLPWAFAILTSKMHVAWARIVGGKMRDDFRYSNRLVYHTFPIPHMTDAQKEYLTQAAIRVIDVREYHCEFTLEDLYNPSLMPDNLRQAHQALDDLVDSLYQAKPFESDEERLVVLFREYERLIAKESVAEEAKKVEKKTKSASRKKATK